MTLPDCPYRMSDDCAQCTAVASDKDAWDYIQNVIHAYGFPSAAFMLSGLIHCHGLLHYELCPEGWR